MIRDSEPLIEHKRRQSAVRWVILIVIWTAGYFAWQLGHNEALAGWLRAVLLSYLLFSAGLGIVVLSVVTWRLSKLFGPQYYYPWWMI